jgi:NADPH-dependent 2,4-dienoyl-CoA reductase/sulfur reductase-like enzyme
MSNRLFEFEIVVVGAGPAGLAAACAAAESGRRVAVVDDTPWLGGQIWRGQQATPSIAQAQQWIGRFRRSGATLLDRTSVIASLRPGVLLAEHDNAPREIRWQQLILATGARELFVPFPGWTRWSRTAGRFAGNASSWPGAGRSCSRWLTECRSTAHV